MADTEEVVSFGFATPTRVDVSTKADPPPDRTAWYASRNNS